MKVQRPETMDDALEMTKELLYECVVATKIVGPTVARCTQIVKCMDAIMNLEERMNGKSGIERLSDTQLLLEAEKVMTKIKSENLVTSYMLPAYRRTGGEYE